MRIAVLIKQVPRFEAMALGPDGRLVRDRIELEMNPYCRRAVSKGVELARLFGGDCTVFTLGPPAAEDALREAVAWGADEGVLISDAAFAGSDTLATSRALAAALRREGPFDLVLAGRNSVDADTGQVGAEVAEMLGYPMLAGVREFALRGDLVTARLESDDGWAEAEVDLPAVLTCAERLCEPAKVGSEGRAAVPADRIRWLCARDLGMGPWGQAGSPTTVGEVRVLQIERERRVLSGPVNEQVAEALRTLARSGALDTDEVSANQKETVADGWSRGPNVVAVLIEAERNRIARELLAVAAQIAREIGGTVTAIAMDGAVKPHVALGWGADQLLVLTGSGVAEDVAEGVAKWCQEIAPWAVLAPSTMWGREVASRVAARLQVGLTGDSVGLTVEGGRLVAWKPAFGGQLIAAVRASSAIQMATIRPGVLTAPGSPRSATGQLQVMKLSLATKGRVRLLASGRDDDVDRLEVAPVIVGVGMGVDPGEYPKLRPLLDALGAELAASRKVTDRRWQPRSRQIGITGRHLAPSLYVALGVSGNFNHMIGVSSAKKILAINHDPEAPVFRMSDLGIVADWRQAVPEIVEALSRKRAVVGQKESGDSQTTHP